jgi:acyl carrier protein
MKLHPTGVVLLGGAMSLGWVALLSACDRQAVGTTASHGDVPGVHDSTIQAARTSDIRERVRKVVTHHLGVEPGRVTDNARLVEDLGADSLDEVELIMALEEEFDVIIPDTSAEHIETVGDVVKLVEGCKPNYVVTDTKDCQILSH